MRLLLSALNFALSFSLGWLVAGAALDGRISWATAVVILVPSILVVGIAFGFMQAWAEGVSNG